MSADVRWILGFDASCGRCSEIAKAAKDAAGQRLEVLPLGDPDVQRWREESLGTNALWVPTLVRVDRSRVHAWTGPAMGVRLLGRLGPGAAIRLFKALGELSRTSHTMESSQGQIGRRRFLKFSAGVGIAVGIVFTGKAPALADASGKARAWVAANKDRLPQTYAAFSEYALPYRKAIYAELSPTVKSRLWSEHFAHYREAHPNLSSGQQQILAEIEAQVRNEDTFRARPPDTQADDEGLKLKVVGAFGEDEARALVATLGPVEPTAPGVLVVDCECSRSSDYCVGKCSGLPSCKVSFSGCGFLWRYACDGMCTIRCEPSNTSATAC